MPTGIWSSRLRSGSAHCDLQLAVEVPVPTGIWSSRWRSGWGQEEAAGEEAEEAEEEKSSVKI